jgi:class 3 adenylate cyclase/tetratricopeptide (TPR) repeat protein
VPIGPVRRTARSEPGTLPGVEAVVSCRRCGAENLAEHKFCSRCGAPLASTCPACGYENPPVHRFCSECGAALEARPSASQRAADAAPQRPERRFVSVLFADLVGFTSLSESRDPEEVRGLLTRYFDRSREVIGRFGGTVEKYIGDAVMAVWGAVEANEDDAERAVRAALELVDAVAELGEEIRVPELALRAGVLSGEASVGPGGNEQGLIVGDLVNTASRLQSMAEPSTVVVGEATQELVREAVRFEPLGSQKVKGKDVPVAAYRALRVMGQRGGRGRSEGIEPPFVGREEELRLLKDQLHGTGRDRRSRLVSVVGEAGIGKSRLAWELLKYVDGIKETVFWHSGRSPSYGEGLTFWALGEMVRFRAGIADTDDPAKSRMKLRTAVADLIPDPEDQRWVEPRLAGLIGIDEMPQGDRSEQFAALRSFFHAIASRGTTVLLFEDLHWADDGLLDFIVELVERSPRHPILVITLARPDLLERRAAWGSGHRSFLSLHLAPLPDASMTALVSGMVPGMSGHAVKTIVERAAGIPLYAVEFVRMLLASGDVRRAGDEFVLVGDPEDLRIPNSLHAVIGARLDRLGGAERSLVEDAAVLGQAFTLRGLQALRPEPAAELEARLRGLLHKELLELEDDPRSPERGQYRFVQSLIREVAYSRVGRAERRERHLRVAEYFRRLDLDELAAATASHYLAAFEMSAPGEEAGLIEKASAALLRAARRAAGLHANRQALALFDRAIEISRSAAEVASLQMLAAQSANHASDVDRAVDYARQALSFARSTGDPDTIVQSATLLASIYNDNFRSDEGIALLEPVYEEHEDIGGELGVGLAAELARSYMIDVRGEAAARVAERAIVEGERLGMIRAVIDAIITRGSAVGWEGRIREATALLRGAVALADDHDLPDKAIRALNNLGVALQWDNQIAVHDVADELLARVRRFGDSAWLFRAVGDRADGMIGYGKLDESERLLDEFDPDELPPFWQNAFELSRIKLGLLRGTSDDFDRAYLLQSKVAEWIGGANRAWIEVALADIDLLRGDHQAAFERVIRLPAQEDVWVVMIGARSAAWARRPDWIEAVAQRLVGVPPLGRMVTGLRHLVGGISAALHDRAEEAAEEFRAGLDIWERVASGLALAGARASFAHLLGSEYPDAVDAGARARAFVTECGASRLLDVWSSGLPASGETRRAG